MTADLLTTPVVADLLKIAPRSVRSRVAAGTITPACREPGRKGRLLFAREEVQRILALQEEQGAPLAGEEWRPCTSAPRYLVSSYGRVASLRPDGARRILKAVDNGVGYLRLGAHYVHHLVAEAFIGPRPAGLEIRHLDGDSRNNAAANLRYGTHSENELDKVRHGTHPFASRSHCLRGHLLEPAPPGRKRFCRTCRRARESQTSARRRTATP